jgi:hypothetical protein
MGGVSSGMRTAADISKNAFNPVDMKPSLITGGAVTMIIFGLIFNYMQNNKVEYTTDFNGCIVDEDGVRISKPIYQKNHKGGNTSVITGYIECDKPLSAFSKYGMVFFGSLIMGLITGGLVYNIMFKIANPKWAAASMAFNSL